MPYEAVIREGKSKTVDGYQLAYDKDNIWRGGHFDTDDKFLRLQKDLARGMSDHGRHYYSIAMDSSFAKPVADAKIGGAIKIMSWNMMNRCKMKRSADGYSNNPWNVEESLPSYLVRAKAQLKKIKSDILAGDVADIMMLQEAGWFYDALHYKTYEKPASAQQDFITLKDDFLQFLTANGWSYAYSAPIVRGQESQVRPLLTLFNANKLDIAKAEDGYSKIYGVLPVQKGGNPALNTGLEVSFVVKGSNRGDGVLVELRACNFHGDYEYNYFEGKDGADSMGEYFAPENGVIKIAAGDTNSHQNRDLSGLVVDYSYATSYNYNEKTGQYNLDDSKAVGQKSAHDGALVSAPPEFGVALREEGREVYIEHEGTIECVWQKTLNKQYAADDEHSRRGPEKRLVWQKDALPGDSGLVHAVAPACRWLPRRLFGADMEDELSAAVKIECGKRAVEAGERFEVVKEFYSTKRKSYNGRAFGVERKESMEDGVEREESAEDVVGYVSYRKSAIYKGKETPIKVGDIVDYYAGLLTYDAFLEKAGYKIKDKDFESHQLGYRALTFSEAIEEFDSNHRNTICNTENSHHFVQVFFPKTTPSGKRPNVIQPVINNPKVLQAYLSANPQKKKAVEKNLEDAVKLLTDNFAYHVKTSKDHNFARACRIIECLGIFNHSSKDRLVRDIYQTLSDCVKGSENISSSYSAEFNRLASKFGIITFDKFVEGKRLGYKKHKKTEILPEVAALLYMGSLAACGDEDGVYNKQGGKFSKEVKGFGCDLDLDSDAGEDINDRCAKLLSAECKKVGDDMYEEHKDKYFDSDEARGFRVPKRTPAIGIISDIDDIKIVNGMVVVTINDVIAGSPADRAGIKRGFKISITPKRGFDLATEDGIDDAKMDAVNYMRTNGISGKYIKVFDKRDGEFESGDVKPTMFVNKHKKGYELDTFGLRRELIVDREVSRKKKSSPSSSISKADSDNLVGGKKGISANF